MSFTKPHIERESIGFIKHEAGREQSIKLPGGQIIERVLLDLKYTLNKNAGLVPSGDKLFKKQRPIDRLTIEVGGDEIWRLPGHLLSLVCNMDWGVNPVILGSGNLAIDATEDVNVILPLSFDLPDMIQPLLNGLDLRGAPDAYIKIYWAADAAAAMYNTPQAVTVDNLTCEVIVDKNLNTDPKLPWLPVRIITVQDRRIYEDHAREMVAISAGTGINIRKIAIVSTRNNRGVVRGNPNAATPPILDGLSELRSGTTKWRDNSLKMDWAWLTIQGSRAEAPSTEVIDLTRYGNRAEMVNTSELNDDIVLETGVIGPTVPGEEVLLQFIVDATRAPKWHLQRRS